MKPSKTHVKIIELLNNFAADLNMEGVTLKYYATLNQWHLSIVIKDAETLTDTDLEERH